MAKNIKNISGKKFGLLTAIRFVKRINGKTYWLWKCDCGKEKIIRYDNIVTKVGKVNTISCGCAFKSGKSKRNYLGRGYKLYQLWYGYKRRCKKLNREFNLNIDEFEHFITQPCHYCGLKPKDHNTIDRIDSRKGYVDGNCVPSCLRCNIAKSTYGYSDFLEWIKKVYDYNYSI